MPTDEDPRQVLRHLDQELDAVLKGGRLYDGSEPYGVFLSARKARAIRELFKAYKQASKTTLADRFKSAIGW
jgi:hypothetical protein